MSQLGRISGQLLKDNLTRNGHDLAFDTDLLYLDVTNRRIGIKNASPSTELDVTGTTQTTNLAVTNQSDLGDITVLGDTITSNTGTLNLTNATGDQVNYQTKLVVDNIDINGNVISTNATGVNLVLDPTGTVEVYADTNVYGNIYATGDIQADGNIIVGNANTDNITFNAEVASDIIPNVNNSFSLGSVSYQWKDLWVKNVHADSVNSNSLTVDGINLTLRQGNIYYVSKNGLDTNSGTHQNDPFLTIKHALAIATSGTTVYIYPGTYAEIFPMTVPVGVNVRGAGIRSVKIVPTVGTNDKDAFLINGDATIEDITVADFYFNNTNNTGYAFKFASNFIVSARSPYIRNVSVLTKGSTTSGSDPRGFLTGDAGQGVYIDGSVANIASKEAAMLFHSATFICPGVDAITCINGARVEWLNSFTYFANKSMNLLSGTSGFAGVGKTRVKIVNKTGTWAVGNTLSYYDTDGSTVLASGVIESIAGDFYNIDGRVLGFERIQDRAGKTISVNGNAKLSTAVKKFGTASLALDGTGDYLSTATFQDFAFGTSAWTFEFWAYRTVTQLGTIIDFRPVSGSTPYHQLNLSSTGVLRYAVSGATVITGTTLTLNTWVHVAVSRAGTNTKLFVNGTQSGATYTDTNNYIVDYSVTIGAGFGGVSGYGGYLDDVRISRGVARYTTTFTLPTVQLTGDLDTVLLLTLNGLNNSVAIADNGITLQDLRTSAGGRASIIDFADYSDFGVEVRSIASAGVYGNYGVYGDGAGVIAYLIGQNLAYIGNGKESSNDPTTVIQANEIVELNKAKIYYNSVDHKGDFRVGDLFYVNQQTGEVSFTNSNVTIGTSLTFDNGLGDVTFLDATKIETGDFRISGNTIQTLTQDFNVSAASNLINLQSNVNISGNLDVTGNVTIGGNITIGDQASDTVSFVAGVNSDIVPTNPLSVPTYNLGTALLQWLHLYASQVSVADVQIDTNVIRTTATDTNLTLQANGSGKIYVPNNNVLLSQGLTVNGTTTLKDTNIGTVGTPATLTHVGALNQTGDLTQTGNINLTGTFTTSSYAQFADILITGDQLKTTIGNNDLTLSAHGTGKIYIPSNDVQIDNNLTVTGYIDVNTLNVDTTISSNSFTTGDIVIDDNTIYTTLGNNNLILEAAGSGKVYVPTSNVQLDQNLTVNGTTYLKDTTIVGTVTQTGAVTQTGDLTQTGSTEITGTLTVGSTAQFQDIKIDTNVITTTIGNNNLTLKANGTGIVIVPEDDVSITQTLTVTGTTSTTTINNTGTITSDTFNTTNVSINGNNITSRTSNSNLVLEAAGSGKIYVPSNNVQLDQNLTVNGTTYLKDTTVVGTVTHTGAVTQTGDLTQTGSTEITGTLTVGSTAQFQDIKIDTNIITTTVGNNNLTLKANGTGIVIIPEDNVSITQTLTVTGTTSTTTINNTGTITSDTFNTTNVSINGNNITSRTSNSNLVLEAAGSGKIYVPSNNVQLDQNLTVNGTTYLKDTTVVGTVTHTGAVTQTGDLTQTGSTEITGTLTVGSTAQFQDIKIDTNIITTTVGNNNLTLKANGTGIVIIPEDNVSITQTLTVTGTTSTTTINNTGTITSDTFNTTNVSINGNTITSRTGDSNLVLEASGTGKIYVPTNNVSLGKTLTVNGNTALASTSITGTLTITGATTQTGNVDQTGSYTLRGNLTVDNIAQFKDINITNNVITTTIGNNNLQLSAAGTGRIYVPTNNVTIENNLTVVGTTTTSTINNTGTVTSGTFSTGNININGNTIQTTASNSNLQLQAAGTGYIQLEQFDIQENEIRINTGSDMVLTPNGFGIVSVNSTQSIKIPVGNTASRPTGAAGMIRFNTELTRYEGHNGTAWVRLDGLEDTDGNTKITAELTPGANDNTIRFYTNGTQVADLTSTRLNVNNLDVGAINVNNNVISTTTTNTNLVLAPNGSGSVRIGNFSFNSNVITNTVNNSITYINQTGNGYVKISNTGGFVIPTGLTEQRPPLFAVGMLRYNTDPGNFRVEVWDGANWVNAGQAAGGGVTIAEATDIGIVSAIIFG